MKIFIIFISFVMSSCVSSSHLGIRQWGNCELTCRTIGMKKIKIAQEFENRVIVDISNGKIRDSLPLFSDTFKKNIAGEEFEAIIRKLDSYEFNGKYKRKQFFGRKFSLDEAVSWDPFKGYDFIGSSFELEGKVAAHVILLYRKKEKFEIVGLSVSPLDVPKINKNNSFKYLYLENVSETESIFCPCGMLLS